MEFSLLYFANRDATDAQAQYQFLFESARFADEAGFRAVWLPERHFHPFGGAYPNPSLAASALATLTSNVRLRAGSVVAPLQHPLRVVEEWGFVDNLSNGRVDLAFATGWNANDFILAPSSFAERRRITNDRINEVRRVWAGEPYSATNGAGEEVTVVTFPRPVQSQLECWLTCSREEEGFLTAGELGLNVLTALLFQRPDELARRISKYRSALEKHHPGRLPHVTLMLHTYVGASTQEAKETIRQPFTRYLASSINLWKQESAELTEIASTRPQDLLRFAFERYFRVAAFFGDVDRCIQMARQLDGIGVDEIACLIDFGLDDQTTRDGLNRLRRIRDEFT